ncbi:hypothetical protein K3495_g2757 [Podosphaera aphanis]|nr:hypothetical protein K3495_g2757 [Podosphaera aphanis]
MPGNFVETPRSCQQPLPFTPIQAGIKSIPPVAPKKPQESFIFLGVPPVPPINLESTESSSSNHVDLPRKSTREKRQAKPGDGMVPNTQRYRANAVQLEPATFKQAMKSDDHELWGKAIEEEMNSLNRNNTWEITTRPKDHNVVGSKWGFKIKHKADGSIERYKARLVAKRFSQQPGTDNDDTYAPVARYDSLRLLLALTAHKGWKPRQLDVKSAFLYGKLDREIYMEIPDGFKEPGKCYLLRKSIYGLKQSPLVWYDTLSNVLNKGGFASTNFDPCVFTNFEKQIFLAIYVDDILIFGPNNRTLNELEETLDSTFECTNLGVTHYILGIQVDITNQGISLNQKAYINKILEIFGMLGCQPVGTPLEPGIQLRKGQPEEILEDPTIYQSIIVTLLSQFSSCRVKSTSPQLKGLFVILKAPLTGYLTFQ